MARKKKVKAKAKTERTQKVRARFADLIPTRETFEAAVKLTETTPPKVLGIGRTLLFGMLSGLTDFASEVTKDKETKKELQKAKSVLNLAFCMELVKDGLGVTETSVQASTAGRPAVASPQPKPNVDWFSRYEEGGRRVPPS